MKTNSIFVCSECGYESPKPQGRCVCGAWNSFYEQKIEKESKNKNTLHFNVKNNYPKSIDKIKSEKGERIFTGIKEFDNVIGGGIMGASCTLITGEPGIGKSTLLLQVAINLAKNNMNILYISGEESLEQIKNRAERISEILPEALYIFSETSMEKIIEEVQKENYSLLIIDSIQTMFTNKIDGNSGGISQIREVATLFVSLAKIQKIPI
ncbi:MAG: DNA repair protein RadA, partial [Clostridiales Family XIII bacterium]|nr:DNA repair protein RadA [Clostridiales Family XIII bacterium]